MSEQSSELPGNWGAGGGWRWSDRTEIFSRISMDEIKTRCHLASTLCAPQPLPKRSRLGLLSLGFLGVLLLLPILLHPLELAETSPYGPVLVVSITGQPLLSTPEPPASTERAGGGGGGSCLPLYETNQVFQGAGGETKSLD